MLRDWDGLGIFHAVDGATGARIYVAYHNATLGPPAGGTRLRSYPDTTSALADVRRLAEAMTYKWAAIGLPFGGGKCVIDAPSPPAGQARRDFFLRYGRLLAGLRGSFVATVDMGTTPEDMDVAARESEHLFGYAPGSGEGRDPGPYTALGVFEGIRAAVLHRRGDLDLEGVTVAIQGVGDVGAPLAHRLAEAGARLVVADLDRARARKVAAEVDGSVVGPDEIYSTQCDVFSPCAGGAVLDDDTIPALQCDIVAGSANNPLQRPRHARLLDERGILYAPDYIVSGGGAVAFGYLYNGVVEEEALVAKVRLIGQRLASVFREAEERGELPVEAARRLAEKRLEDGGTP